MMLEKADADGELSLQLMQEGAVIKIRALFSRAYAAMEDGTYRFFRTTPSLRLSTTIISLERRF